MGQIKEAPLPARARLARALGLPGNASPAEIALECNRHQSGADDVRQLELQRRTIQLMATRGMSRTRALWMARNEAKGSK